MQKRLSEKFIDSIKATDKRQRFTDLVSPNLTLIVQPTGSKSWVWFGRVNGKLSEVRLGKYPLLDVTDAREAADKLTVDRDGGADVVSAKKKVDAVQKEEAAAAVAATEAEKISAARTCQWLFDIYMEHEGDDRKSADEKRKMWNSGFKAKIGGIPVSDVDHDTLMSIIREKHRTAPVQARNMVALIKRMFKWAVTHGRDLSGMKVNPAVDVFKISVKSDRDRFLSDEEIVCFFDGLEAMTSSARDGLMLILYTGVRQQECFAAKWSEFDLTKGYWIIPKERSKNGREHLVPLPETMLRLLRNMKAAAPKNAIFLFPAAHDPKQHRQKTSMSFLIESMNKKTQEAATARFPKMVVEHFTIHDLRRTLVTGMNGMLDEKDEPLIPADIVERCVNHTIGGIKGTYNKHGYLAEKKRAFKLWADRLNKLRGLNVLEFAQAA